MPHPLSIPPHSPHTPHTSHTSHTHSRQSFQLFLVPFGCDYLYSKSVLLKPLPWTSALAQLRDRITAANGYSFRIVIGNQYRSGIDSIGWHNDSEASMGLNPAIASISLGSVRKFQIKPRNGKATDFWLEHGSLLMMHPGCQSTHLHQVPKTNKVVSTRINLTFRPHTGGGR